MNLLTGKKLDPFILIYARTVPRAQYFDYRYDAESELNIMEPQTVRPAMQMSTGSLITRAYGDHTSDESTDR